MATLPIPLWYLPTAASIRREGFTEALRAAGREEDGKLIVEGADWQRICREYAKTFNPLTLAQELARREVCAGCQWHESGAPERCNYPQRCCAMLHTERPYETCPLSLWPSG